MPSAPDPLGLARRIEGAQAAQMAATVRASGGGASAIAAARGHAFRFGPRSPYSAAVGLGLAGPVAPAELDRVEAHLGRGGGVVRVEVCAFADPSLGALLGARGYALERFHQVWARPPLPLPSAPEAEVRPMRPDEEDLWIDLFVEIFLADRAEEGVRAGLRAMPRAEGNVCFLAFAGGAPAGIAIASADGGVAQLTGAGILPRFRGAGLQAALVRARLAWAGERGCDLAASATEPATASQRTLERTGFRCVYPKAVLARAAS
jgi:GNAT superfamily N-acetyltransferase